MSHTCPDNSNDSYRTGSFFARDNILMFLEWAQKLVSASLLFTSQDLIEGRDEETIWQAYVAETAFDTL